MTRTKNCGHQSEEKLGTNGNPCEGGTCYFRCKVCGIVRALSEDGTEYFPKSFKPCITSIADGMRRAGMNPKTATDEDVIRFLGGN
jgi:hypothetical protein